MQEILPQIAHRKLFFVLFLTCFLLLTVSYYDAINFLNYQFFFTTLAVNYSTYNDTASQRLNITSNYINDSTILGTATGSSKMVVTSKINANISSTAVSNVKLTSIPLIPNSTILTSLVENITSHRSTSATAPKITSSMPETKDYDGFLVENSKCKIINLNPFNEDAKKYFIPRKHKTCTDKELLTYIEKTGNVARLHIDKEIVPFYSKNGVRCCKSDIKRTITENDPDDHIVITDCQPFNDNVTLSNDFVFVKCTDNKSKAQIYENVHATVTITEHVRNKTKTFSSENPTVKPINVMFVGVDSVSRLQFLRGLPNTLRYLEENEWLPLKGYNKMDDNTFPNLMAILTGFNQSYAYQVCNPRQVGELDKCPLIWKDFRNLGYVTGYGEDFTDIGTFNYHKKGFRQPPTDYYFRPYVIAAEKLKKVYSDGMMYCLGPVGAGQRILNAAKEFSFTMKDEPMFGFFWTNTFSHNDLNTVTGMDNQLKSFLTDLEHGGVLNTTIVIFLSDHGVRFGDIRTTETGWLEERLPFIYVSFPPWFKEKFPQEYENFKNNSNRFTTPYDMHMTLKHILVLGGFNYTMSPGNACPACRSLFEEVPFERGCEDANIEQHWCTCIGYKTTKLPQDVELKLSTFLLSEIQKVLVNHTSVCEKYKLDTILTTRLSQKLSTSNSSFVLVQMRTNPKAVFEMTVKYEGDIDSGKYVISGDVSRLDYYATHSNCVSSAYIKKYCYCIAN